nr:tetratricopeptide repeat protein [Mariprofundus sp. NF]
MTILKIPPVDPDANNLLGKIAEHSGDLDEAKVLYLRGHENNPKHLNLLISLAQLNNKTRDYESAIHYWQLYLKLKPYSGDVWQALSCEWYSLRQWGKAETAARQCLKHSPKRAMGHTNLGQSLLQQQRYDEAIVCFETSIEIDPDNADAWYNLAVLILQKGDMDEAFKTLNKALELNPYHADSLSRLLRFKKIDSYNDIVKRAENAFNAAFTPPEDRITIGFGLGKAWEGGFT